MFGWFKRPKENEPDRLPETMHAIIGEYGAVLEDMNSDFAPVSDLPFEKDVIEKALKVAIQTTDDEEMREQLKIGFFSLAYFQELSDEEDAASKIHQAAMASASEGSKSSDDELVNRVLASHALCSAVREKVSLEMSARRQLLAQWSDT